MIDCEDLLQLQQARLLANVSLESVEHLLERCRWLNLERGEHLLEAGAANSDLYLILDGELRVYSSDHRLPERAVFGAGDCVGEMSLLDGQQASALVLAARDTRLLAIPHDVLWALVDCSHGVARNLLAIMSGRMRNDDLAMISSQSQSLEFEQAASVDALTGIHNRRWLLEAYPRAMERCERNAEPLCLVIADIDGFKRFNDRHGHLAGDAVLRRVARQLHEGLRAQDLIARHGGEEFLILLPHSDIDEALLIAERLRGRVGAGSAPESGEGRHGVTLSGGVAQMQKGETLGQLTARADTALRSAKDNGRDRVEVAVRGSGISNQESD